MNIHEVMRSFTSDVPNVNISVKYQCLRRGYLWDCSINVLCIRGLIRTMIIGGNSFIIADKNCTIVFNTLQTDSLSITNYMVQFTRMCHYANISALPLVHSVLLSLQAFHASCCLCLMPNSLPGTLFWLLRNNISGF